MLHFVRFYGLVLMIPLALAAAGPPKIEQPSVMYDSAAINDPALMEIVGPQSRGSAVVRAQILLDRTHFSSGEIDGSYGRNLRKAIVAYQTAHGLRPTGVVDVETWTALNTDQGPALTIYTIAPQDIAGPFYAIPKDMMEKAKVPAMTYESPLEGMSETFHINPELLVQLNPGKDFGRAGEQISAPNVAAPLFAKAAQIVVDKSSSSVEAVDSSGKILAYYPATIGSGHDPLPVGNWKVTGINRDPIFFYNPDLFWDADEEHSKARIAPGPNNPVGVVWIRISKEHVGIHGSPEPSKIGHTQSHGCIRLTNWDASELASMVAAGTPAIFKP
jgi:lipoprotein-anchoring transpeptidase ErfK/SrfK